MHKHTRLEGHAPTDKNAEQWLQSGATHLKNDRPTAQLLEMGTDTETRSCRNGRCHGTGPATPRYVAGSGTMKGICEDGHADPEPYKARSGRRHCQKGDSTESFVTGRTEAVPAREEDNGTEAG